MIIYVNGSYRDKESCTCGFIGLDKNNRIKYQYKYVKKYKDKWTIHRVDNSTYAELMAIRRAVIFAIQNNIKVTIYTNFNSVNNIIENNICRNSYICSFQKFMRKYKDKYEIRWIKRSNKNKFNNYVNMLCRDNCITEMNGKVVKVDLGIQVRDLV